MFLFWYICLYLYCPFYFKKWRHWIVRSNLIRSKWSFWFFQPPKIALSTLGEKNFLYIKCSEILIEIHFPRSRSSFILLIVHFLIKFEMPYVLVSCLFFFSHKIFFEGKMYMFLSWTNSTIHGHGNHSSSWCGSSLKVFILVLEWISPHYLFLIVTIIIFKLFLLGHHLVKWNVH